MSINKTTCRKTIWEAIDAANTAISNAQYAAIDATATVVDTAADAVIVDIGLVQTDIDALELKNDIVASKGTNNAAHAIDFLNLPSTTGSIKIVDAAGVLVGYTPVYATATLT